MIHQTLLNINYSREEKMQVVVASHLHKRACGWKVASLNPKTTCYDVTQRGTKENSTTMIAALLGTVGNLLV